MCALAGTWRLNGIELEAWFSDVIERVGDHPINRNDDFLPWQWQAARREVHLEEAAGAPARSCE
nr:transposase domain-containing protein [Sphingomonas sp. CL5.1]